MHSSSIALWYLSRATGVVCLVLFTAVVVLGLLVAGQRKLPGLPRFGVISLHRYLSLLALGFLAVHIATATADSFVNISPIAAVVPFASVYQPLWLGLGAIAVDLAIAVILTSLIRARIGRRSWRLAHWLAYACWPVAVLHSIGTGPDLRSGLPLWVTIASVLAVLGAVGWRLTGALRQTPRSRLVPELLAAHDLRPPQDLKPRAHLKAMHQ
jgi:sulfoxide reductase heme-binding subunit YedZ